MDLAEALKSVDLNETIDKMTAYAISRLKSVGIKNFNGKEPYDFVGDVILKVLNGDRDWNKAQCSFTVFLFGCLQSDIYDFFVTNKMILTAELPEIPSNDPQYDIVEKRKQLSDLLYKEGADDEELTLFEYWMDGMRKPSDIAKDLGVEAKVIYNITKRLERRILSVQNQTKDIL